MFIKNTCKSPKMNLISYLFENYSHNYCIILLQCYYRFYIFQNKLL